MKKIFILCISLIAFFLFTGCGSVHNEQPKTANDKRVSDAIEIITQKWSEVYENSSLDIEDKYLEITNTKVINILPEADGKFKDISYIVEFSLESNFYNSTPYHNNLGSIYSIVAVYTDGKSEILGTNPFLSYIKANGPTDFKDIIESVENYGNKYDQVLEIK